MLLLQTRRYPPLPPASAADTVPPKEGVKEGAHGAHGVESWWVEGSAMLKF